MCHAVLLAGLYGLGFAFVVAALWDRRRVADDKRTVGEWYGMVCSALADAERASAVAVAASGRAAKMLQQAEEKTVRDNRGVTIFR